jgi:hypothetical protein
MMMAAGGTRFSRAGAALGRRIGRAKLMALFLSPMVVVSAGLLEAAFAQEAFPWAKFIELSGRKGQDVTQGGPCQHLGLSPDCRAYQVAFQEDEWTHTFNVIRTRNARTGHLILYKRSDLGSGLFYLTDRNGKLLRAVSRREGTAEGRSSWSKRNIDAKEVRGGFAEEIAFWRSKQAELENEPDRKD